MRLDFVSLFPYNLFVQKRKTAGCYDLYIKDRASATAVVRLSLFACTQGVLATIASSESLQDIKSNICFRSLCLSIVLLLIALTLRSLASARMQVGVLTALHPRIAVRICHS